MVLDLPKSSMIYQPAYGRQSSRKAPRREPGRSSRSRKKQQSQIVDEPAEEADQRSEISEDPDQGENADELSKDIDEPDQQSSHAVQILDVASEKPIVKYKGNFYRCRWADLVGTEMLFSTQSRKSHHLPVVHQAPGFSLHALSTIKLAGHPMSVAERHASGLQPKTSKFTPQALKERQIQHGFLSKLAEIKKQRGETDEVPVITAQPWGGVRGQRKDQFRDGIQISGEPLRGDSDDEGREEEAAGLGNEEAGEEATGPRITKRQRVPRKAKAASYVPDDRPAVTQLWRQRSGRSKRQRCGSDSDPMAEESVEMPEEAQIEVEGETEDANT